jgi:hypothetical protein
VDLSWVACIIVLYEARNGKTHDYPYRQNSDLPSNRVFLCRGESRLRVWLSSLRIKNLHLIKRRKHTQRQLQGRIQGSQPARAPPKIGKNMIFFGVKSWFFTRNTPKTFAPPSARHNLFKCAPPNLKSWIRPWVRWSESHEFYFLLFLFYSIIFIGVFILVDIQCKINLGKL